MTLSLFAETEERIVAPFKSQLLKWVGNKQKFAHEIIACFPQQFNAYHEPFLGSGAILGTLAPHQGYASDIFGPLMEIWKTLHDDPSTLIEWYTTRWKAVQTGDKTTEYEHIKADYNKNPNGADLVFLCRSCYGGVVRFRQADGYMSTPCGVHDPISPASFAARVKEWRHRTAQTMFATMDFEEAMNRAQAGDCVYCDPPYSFTQSILYGAQTFSLERLFQAIQRCKQRGVSVALSIDGTKQSGNLICNVPIPEDLFERELLVNCGRSMLKRFQMGGQTLEGELVADRLLLTY